MKIKPARLALTELSVGTASGAAFTTQPQVTIINNVGQTGTHTSAVISAAISAGGTLVGTTTAFASNGVATFSNLGIIGVAGVTYTITYSVGALTIATQAVTASVGAASRLALTRLSVGPASGVAFTTQPQLTIQDAGGNTVTSSSAVVTATISAGGTMVGTTTATAVSGVATFSNLGSTGVAGATYTVTYSSGALTVATQSVSVPVQVPVGAASRLALTRPSVGPATGAAFTTQPQVTIQDAAGSTVTSSSAVVIATISAGGTIVGTNTATAVSGVATFSNLGSTGVAGTAYTITYYTISHLPNFLTTVTQVVNTVVGAATKLAVIRSSAGTASAAAFTTQPQVVVQDAGGNTVTGSSAVITAAMTAGGGTFGGTLTATAGSGVATFSNLSITGTIGARTITYTSGSLTLVAEPVTLTFGAATQLALTTSATTAASTVAFSPQTQITIRDSAGNAVTNSTVVVTATITDAGAGGTLGGTNTATAVDGTGIATYTNLSFNRGVNAVGNRTITYTSGSLTLVTHVINIT